ncbi:Rhodanese-like domain-containing protein [Hyaloraphidium curvatum]|nr:Rhodanese-like domain-containing protein [Hyaloraphidium curvatum]
MSLPAAARVTRALSAVASLPLAAPAPRVAALPRPAPSPARARRFAAAAAQTVEAPQPPAQAAPQPAPAPAPAFGAVPTFVSSEWLDRNIGLVVPVDATYHLPNANRNAHEEYRKCHLKNARFFDIDRVSLPGPLPHMLPTPEEFSKQMGALGISDTDHVVIYDSHGLFSAPRAWWMFKWFGHAKVSILEGGLPQWVKEERAVMDSEVKPKPKFYKARRPDMAMVRNFQQMIANVDKADQNPAQAEQVIDGRPADRFNGEAPEPRKVPSGSMPFSTNLPTSLLVTPTGSLISRADLLALLKERSVDPSRPVVATCGSGVSAAVIILALHERLGIPLEKLALYDGSWTEWAGGESRGAVIVNRGPKVQISGGWLG